MHSHKNQLNKCNETRNVLKIKSSFETTSITIYKDCYLKSYHKVLASELHKKLSKIWRICTSFAISRGDKLFLDIWTYLSSKMPLNTLNSTIRGHQIQISNIEFSYETLRIRMVTWFSLKNILKSYIDATLEDTARKWRINDQINRYWAFIVI